MVSPKVSSTRTQARAARTAGGWPLASDRSRAPIGRWRSASPAVATSTGPGPAATRPTSANWAAPDTTITDASTATQRASPASTAKAP